MKAKEVVKVHHNDKDWHSIAPNISRILTTRSGINFFRCFRSAAFNHGISDPNSKSIEDIVRECRTSNIEIADILIAAIAEFNEKL